MAEDVKGLFTEYLDTLNTHKADLLQLIAKGCSHATQNQAKVLILAAENLIASFSSADLPANVELDQMVTLTDSADVTIKSMESLLGVSNAKRTA